MVEAQVMHLPDDGDHHHHSHYQVVVGLLGEADIDVDGKGAHLDASHACILPTQVAHDFWGDARNNVLVINIDEHMPALREPGNPEYEFLHRFFDKPRQITLDKTLQALIRSCSAELSRREDNPALQHYLAAGIVQCMGSGLLEISPGRAFQGPGKTVDMVKVDRYIEANLHRSISVEDLASCVCMSRSHFHDRFRYTQGLTPHQYLLRARLERARVLIEETGLPLWDISHRAGFSSQSALTNAMRKHLDLTPSSLRRRKLVHGQP
jgi:AraC-like DNA-binding protein